MKQILLAFLCLFSSLVWAQQGDYQKACARYKTVQTVTAKCQRVRHKKVVAKDEVLQGSFRMSRPDKVNITMDGGKEALDMNGTQFTMTMKGKPHKTSSKTGDLEIKKDGGDILLIITPKAEGKAAKRMMFTSFILSIDGKNGEIKSLRMNERGDNYTLYTFSDYQWK